MSPCSFDQTLPFLARHLPSCGGQRPTPPPPEVHQRTGQVREDTAPPRRRRICTGSGRCAPLGGGAGVAREEAPHGPCEPPVVGPEEEVRVVREVGPGIHCAGPGLRQRREAGHEVRPAPSSSVRITWRAASCTMTWRSTLGASRRRPQAMAGGTYHYLPYSTMYPVSMAVSPKRQHPRDRQPELKLS